MKILYKALRRSLLLVVLTCSSLAIPIANAQTLTPAQRSAVMNVINMFLLSDEVTSITIDFNAINQSFYTVNKDFTVEFGSQSEDIELCFDYTRQLQNSSHNPAITLNGAALAVSSGENCFTMTIAQQQANNILYFDVTGLGGSIRLGRFGVESVIQSELTLPILTRSSWEETHVRKVLKIFAFGGHATTYQIKEWADMHPKVAIAEMLNFAEHNLKLSPLASGERYPQTASQYGTLVEFTEFLSSPSSDLPIPPDEREQYGFFENNFDAAFARMVTTRGLNPFRQKIGFWETNYHLAVNLDTAVNGAQLATYYDQIMDLHEKGFGYRNVIGAAARSAAVATQYGHRNNRWVNNRCRCNDDFAREIHQLFYGIFGEHDPIPGDGISGPDYHENVTIPNTAKMLTDMRVNFLGDELTTNVLFGTAEHHVGDLEILGANISGSTAGHKINALMNVSTVHPETLHNLPIMIISGLGDDNLNETKSNQLRLAWASMGLNKSFLNFVRAYAISDLFHSPDQFKYLTSHERALYRANKFNLDNTESYIGGNFYGDSRFGGGRAGIEIDEIIEDDRAGEIFEPLNNVFGAQAPLEAADSALVFENNYDRSTEDESRTREAVQCRICANDEAWEKKWADVLPVLPNGQYQVSEVAEWLWMHTVGNLDNYTILEQAQLYAILGATRYAPAQSHHQEGFMDFPLLACFIDGYEAANGSSFNTHITILFNDDSWGNYCVRDDDGGVYTPAELALLNRSYTGQDIENDPVLTRLVQKLDAAPMPLTINNANWRRASLERINAAMNFIFATPFVFAEGASQ